MKTFESKGIRHSVIEYFLFIPLLLLMWIISGWNTYNYDIENYIRYYNRNFNELSILDLADPGFNFINKTFNNFNISFESYHIIIYGIILLYLLLQIWKRSYKPVLIVFVYIFTSYFADIIQIRNFIALLFLYLGLFSLIDSNEEYPKVKFLICNLLASSIHISFVFYFLFLLVDIKIKPSIIIFSSVVLSVAGHKFLTLLSSITYIAENEFLTDRAAGYLETSSIWSVIICTCQYLVHFIVCRRMVGSTCQPNVNSTYFMRLTTYLSVLIIMTSINMTFFRLFRNLLLFSSIYIINGFILKPTKNNLFLLIVYIISMSYFHFWNGSVFDNVPLIFMNNSLL